MVSSCGAKSSRHDLDAIALCPQAAPLRHFTREEARVVLSHTEGTPRLMANLLDGSGMCLME
jgi:hypothetical protein